MASRKRVLFLSSLSAAIAAALSCAASAANPADAEQHRLVAAIQARSSEMYAEAVQQWLLKHGEPAPPRPPVRTFVTSCEDDGSPGTLRDVLENVFTGDTVDLTHLVCGELTLKLGSLQPNPFSSTFTIQGPGMHRLTISGANASQVIYFAGQGVLHISDLTITEGYANNSWGGCLLAYRIPSGGFDLNRVAVTNCTTHQANTVHGTDAFGGGIMVNAMLSLVDSIVTGNELNGELAEQPYPYINVLAGGGAFSLAGPVTVTRSVISDNRIVSELSIPGDEKGGGLCVRYSLDDVTISDSIISHNTLHSTFLDTDVQIAWLAGAGVFAYAGNTGVGDLVISNTTIDHNEIIAEHPVGHVYGGGLVEAMTTTITNSTISNNYAPGLGGGAMLRGLSARVIDSTVSGNTSLRDGGGIFVAGNISFDNSTLAFNTSATGIGGFAINGPMTIRSSIIAGNAGATAPDIGFWPYGLLNGNHSFIGDPAGIAVPSGTLTGDPMLAPLADNGGPTQTHALLDGSPAIDAGINTLQLEFDQRGSGYARVHGAAADIGAFETVTLAEDTVFSDSFDG